MPLLCASALIQTRPSLWETQSQYFVYIWSYFCFLLCSCCLQVEPARRFWRYLILNWKLNKMWGGKGGTSTVLQPFGFTVDLLFSDSRRYLNNEVGAYRPSGGNSSVNFVGWGTKLDRPIRGSAGGNPPHPHPHPTRLLPSFHWHSGEDEPHCSNSPNFVLIFIQSGHD